MSELTALEVIAADQERFIKEKLRTGEPAPSASQTYQDNFFALARDSSRRHIATMPWLPQLPEMWAQDIYDRIEAQERRLVAPHLLSDEYELGTATYPDEVMEVGKKPDHQFVFSAEHATEPVRFGSNKRERADVGTGGLAAVLGQDYGRGIIMVGDQTSNAPIDPSHPIKTHIAHYVPTMDGFAAVHGTANGMFVKNSDRTEVQATIGLGADPSDAHREYARKIIEGAKDLGIYAIIGNDTSYYVQKNHSHLPKRNDDGSLYQYQLMAGRSTSTTNFVNHELNAVGQVKPVFQIELTRFLRLTPEQSDERDHVSRVIGVALGYKLLESAVKATIS